FDPEKTPKTVRCHEPPQVMLAYLKYQWSLGDDQKRKDAFSRLQDLAIEISSTSGLQPYEPTEILSSFRHATLCATKWAKAWHTWALFSTAVMSHYTLRGLTNFASQFVVAIVTGYFHSIACATHAKGVDDGV
ncbi:serine/threonine-protein kinase TOR isoform X2, partial [Tanacetum coccineum]